MIKIKSTTLNMKVFVPPSFEGVSSVAVLEEIIQGDIQMEIIYTNNLDFREYKQFFDADIILILGLAYRGYILPDDFYNVTDVPFMDFTHIATFGEQVKGNNYNSIVDTEQDPIKVLYEQLIYNPDTYILSKFIEPTAKAEQLVRSINSYRTWTWEGDGVVQMLLALYHASYKRLPNLVRGKGIEEIVRGNAAVIRGQLEKMSEYISRKVEMTKDFTVTVDGGQAILRIVYADDYVNELANKLLQYNTALPLIVCVGRATKGNDIISIRTREISAGRVANLLNGGGGKEQVASTFMEVGYAELMGKSIQTMFDRGVQ